MSPLPGQPLFVEGRYHVFGARHPLQRDAVRLLIRSAVIALLLIAAAFASVYVPRLFRKNAGGEGGEVNLGRTEVHVQLPDAPNISKLAPGIAVPGFKPGGRPPTAALGIPDPVPDLQAEAQTIASQTEMGMPINPDGIEGLGGGGGGAWGSAPVGDIPSGPIDSLLSPDAFVAVDQMPIPVQIPEPQYPKLAREANIEGQVRIRALVGEDGKVKDTRILDGHASLTEAAEKAVRRGVFKPALQNNRPVAVWVVVPINFTLN
jgi:periplasmic protein TonB